MLIGCCHCGSESTPPSESLPSESTPSSSSVGPPTIIVPGCDPPLGGCLGDEIPLVFGVTCTATTGSQNACFTSAYLGNHVLLFVGGVTDCSPWESAARAKNATGCVDVSSSTRWSVGMSITGPGSITRITCTALATIGGTFGSVAQYRLNIGSSPVNCVSSFILTRISTNLSGWPFATTIQVYAI